MRRCLLTVIALTLGLAAPAQLGLAAPAHAATVSVEGGVLRVTAQPGEGNAFEVAEDEFALVPDSLTVSDESGEPLTAGPGCSSPGLDQDPEEDEEWGDDEEEDWEPDELQSTVSCQPASQLDIDAGDQDDSAQVNVALPTQMRGGDGDDYLAGGELADTLHGGSGDDRLYGDEGDDRLLGERGSDTADGGGGRDRIEVRDRKVDSTACGSGRDSVRAEVLDSLDFACERVDYGPPGRIGRLRTRTGGGRFVPVPGQHGTSIDRRLLPDILQLIRKYRIDLGDCFARSGHTPRGEHPLGLACDIVPGPGGSWNLVDKLARWAEPRQNRPRPPFRWVGYKGDENHGRGDHLHLSWDHTAGRPGKPVRSVWVWQVGR